MTESDKLTESGFNTPTTPAESDETLEPVDISEVDHERLLFYLAGRVPVPIQELAENTKQSAAVLREYFYEKLQNQVDIDSTGFVRLTDSARKSIIRASKPYIKSGQNQFDTGQSLIDQSFFDDAIDHLEMAIRIFEQIRTRFGTVNYASEKLDQRLETAQSSIEEAQEAIGDSANRVETLHDDDGSGAKSNASLESSPSGSGSNIREAMLETVRDLHERLGRVPKTTELPEECEYIPNDFYSEFGSWDETLEAAGIDKEQALLEDIKRVAEKLGRVPTSSDMDEHGTYSGSNYSSYFDSWSTALEQSGLEEEREENLLETLQSLNDRLDRLPKGTDVRDVSGISQHDYIRNFGSWDEALEAAGIDKEQYLIDDIRQVAAKVDGKPGTTAVNRFGEYSSGMHQKYFGSWDAALEAAGLSSMDTATGKGEEKEGQSSGTAAIDPSVPIEEITSHVDSFHPQVISRLKSAGYATLGDLSNAELREIAKQRGIRGREAIDLVSFANKNVSQSQDTPAEQSEKQGPGSTPSESTLATSDDGEPSENEGPEIADDGVNDCSKQENPTEQDLVDAYKRVARKLGQRPRKDQFLRGTEYSEATILGVFEDWEHAYNDVFNEVDLRIETNTEQQGPTTDQSTSTQTTGTPTQDQLKEEIEAIAKDIGKRPSTGEFDIRSEEFTTDEVYDAFGSWRSATSAASFDEITREALLEDIHRLVEELQYTPRESQIEEYGRFTPYDYQDEFGSVGEAVTEAGYHLKPSVKAGLKDVAQTVGGRPSTLEFNEHSPYNTGAVYKFYDSWGAAIDDIVLPETAASNDNSSGRDSKQANTTARSSDSGLAPNELAERYETISNLKQLLLAIEDLIVDTRGAIQSDDPMQDWLDDVQSFFMDPGYGEQQRDRNDFTMDEYREAYGDGNHVLEFQTIDAEPPSHAMQALLNPHYDGDVSNLYIPVSEETGRRFPVLVESNAELEDARTMLELLPDSPPAKGSKSTSTTIPEVDSETESKNSNKEPEGMGTATGESASRITGSGGDAEATSDGLEELLEIPVLTEEMAEVLQKAGYHDRAALAEAGDGEISAVEGISEQIAMRIVLDVTTD